MSNKIYNKVYDFTNENVSCLKDLYHFENSKVLTVVGSGDQYFSSILFGAKKVDLFDINSTAYLYFILKFYSIRELTFEEFYDLLILKNFNNIIIYKKLEKILPEEVLKYYKYLMLYSKKNKSDFFRMDGISLLSKQNQKYYLKNKNTVIPYFNQSNYYKLQKKIKQIDVPKFYNCDILNNQNEFQGSYDIILMSNIYNLEKLDFTEYTKMLKRFNCPEIQAFYDWYGDYFSLFRLHDYCINLVPPSSPTEFNKYKNFVYSLKK